jgi:hypothetical protein
MAYWLAFLGEVLDPVLLGHRSVVELPLLHDAAVDARPGPRNARSEVILLIPPGSLVHTLAAGT